MSINVWILVGNKFLSSASRKFAIRVWIIYAHEMQYLPTAKKRKHDYIKRKPPIWGGTYFAETGRAYVANTARTESNQRELQRFIEPTATPELISLEPGGKGKRGSLSVSP